MIEIYLTAIVALAVAGAIAGVLTVFAAGMRREARVYQQSSAGAPLPRPVARP